MNKKIWQDFTHSQEFSELRDYPSEAIKFILENFFGLMKDNGYSDIAKWNINMIFETLMAIVDQSENDDSPESEYVLVSFYNVLHEFLKFSAKENLLPISLLEMTKRIDDFEEATGIQGGTMSEPFNEMDDIRVPVVDDPSLPRWLEYVSDDINEYTGRWVDAYFKSPNWSKRAEGVDADLVKIAMSVLTNEAYDIYRKTPKTWTKKAIHGVLTNYFINDMNLTQEDYQHVVPALTGLLTYVTEQGFISEKKSDNYKRFLAASEAEMIELSHDSNNDGIAKKIMGEMVAQGIDPDDDAAVLKFLEQVDDESKMDIFYGDDDDSFDGLFDGDITLTDEQLIGVAKVYDPDKDEEYLNFSHATSNGKNKWDREVAKQTHSLGVQYGIKLYAKTMTFLYRCLNKQACRSI